MPYPSHENPDDAPKRLRRLGEFVFDHIRAAILVVMISICLIIIVSSTP